MSPVTILLLILLALLIVVVFLIFLRLFKLLGKANKIAEQVNSQTLPLVNSRLEAFDIAPLISLVRGISSSVRVAQSVAGVFSEVLKTVSSLMKGRKQKAGSEKEVREMRENR